MGCALSLAKIRSAFILGQEFNTAKKKSHVFALRVLPTHMTAAHWATLSNSQIYCRFHTLCIFGVYVRDRKIDVKFEYNETTVFRSPMYTPQESFKGDGYRD